jgi:hypothetical protein
VSWDDVPGRQLIMLARDRVIEHLQLAHKLPTQPRFEG